MEDNKKTCTVAFIFFTEACKLSFSELDAVLVFELIRIHSYEFVASNFSHIFACFERKSLVYNSVVKKLDNFVMNQ